MKVYVIGGGAAGMISAICAARKGSEVVILERNEKVGKKLFITGKGRCNLTNASPVQNHMDHTVRNGKFLFGAHKVFDSSSCIEFFEDLGVALKTERGNRVFPVSDKSSDVIKALSDELKRLQVRIFYNERVQALQTEGQKIVAVVTDKKTYTDVDYLILATGGITYPATGSTGDGYRLAKSCGHTVVEPLPSLCDLSVREDVVSLKGISLKNVTGSVVLPSGKTVFSEFGEMLFTDKGIGGPIALTASAKLCREQIRGYRFCIDLKPALDEETLDRRLIRDFDEQTNKALKNVLGGVTLHGLVPYVLRQSKIAGERAANSIAKEERKKLVLSLKNLSFTLDGLDGKERAVITSGGVSVAEINPKTMQSKLTSNLAFAGEIIDVDAMTGGYNLQIAFETGFVAGSNVPTEEL